METFEIVNGAIRKFRVKYECIRCGLNRTFYENEEAVQHLRTEHFHISGYKRRYTTYPEFDSVFRTVEY